MAAYQFLRVESRNRSDATGIIAEADRHPGACNHVPRPLKPKWIQGGASAIEAAIDSYMAEPTPVTLKTGSIVYRKQRGDRRCLVSGVVAYPESMDSLKDKKGSDDQERMNQRHRREQLVSWIKETKRWLSDQWGDKLIAQCLHFDESHPHLHFFVVGDAQRLHPGLREELVNDRRNEDSKARRAAHKLGLKRWLDDYHQNVSVKFGHERGDGTVRPHGRIKDRAAWVKMQLLKEQIDENPDPDRRAQLQREHDKIHDDIGLVPTEGRIWY